MTDEPVCRSCGVPFSDHGGLILTCEKLNRVSSSIRRVAEVMAEGIDGRSGASDDAKLMRSFYEQIKLENPDLRFLECAIRAREKFMQHVFGID